MKPGLYIVGTPIGNLEDISARALEILRGVDVILAEDTRHTRILLGRYQIRAALISCHQFNEASRGPVAIARIQAGQAVAYTPGAASRTRPVSPRAGCAFGLSLRTTTRLRRPRPTRPPPAAQGQAARVQGVRVDRRRTAPGGPSPRVPG